MQPKQPRTSSGHLHSETSVQDCLATIGISHLPDWDVLSFVNRHALCLTSPEHIARHIGYEHAVVADALIRLENEKLILSSRESSGMHVYRILEREDDERGRSFKYLCGLSESREGRLQLTKHLKPIASPATKEEMIG